LLVDRERPGCGLGDRLALHVRWAETEEAVEMVDRREREIDRCGLPAVVDFR